MSPVEPLAKRRRIDASTYIEPPTPVEPTVFNQGSDENSTWPNGIPNPFIIDKGDGGRSETGIVTRAEAKRAK